MEFFVSEPYSPYDYERQIPPHPAFHLRYALTHDEIVALQAFQDLGVMQDIWDVLPPDEIHVNCSIINSYLRDERFRDELSVHDTNLCNRMISLIDSAISKSVLTRSVNVIRGLSDSRWIDSFSVGTVYTENGYGCYSLSASHAVSYAGVNDYGRQIFLARTLDSGCKAVYLGQKEEEMLIERGRKYVVDEIVDVGVGELSPEYEATVYMLKEI